MKVLIIAEIINNKLSAATRSAITAGKIICDKIDILIFGNNCQLVAEEASIIEGVSCVFVFDDPILEHQMPEHVAKLTNIWLLKNIQNYISIIAAATNFGKAMLPILAAKLDLAQQTEVIKIIDHKTIVRPTYAGNALNTVESLEKILLMTIRATAFARAINTQSPSQIKHINHNDDEISIATELNKCLTKFIESTPVDNKRPDLSQADAVVSGGRGLGSADDFKLIYELADSLGAAVGASRAAVDAGYISNEHQVGQTGVVVAPELYVAVGISGAIQHISGMKDSKIIVAINKDPNAPIMKIANYRLVGDLFKLVPEWIQKINQHIGR